MPARILVIEHHRDQAQALNKMLELNGYSSRIALTGNVARSLLRIFDFDMVVFNMELPDESGVQLLRHIKRNLPKPMPVIVLSDITHKEYTVGALAAGASDYINKPYDNEELLIRIKLHLEINEGKRSIERINDELRAQTKQLDWIVQQKSLELQTYLDAINISIYSAVTDLNGMIVRVNEPLLRASGYSEQDLLGTNFSIFDSGYHSSEFFQSLYENILAGKIWRGEMRNKSKGGSLFWVDMVVLPLKDSHQAIQYFLVLALPITERKQAEEKRNQTLRILEDIAFQTSHKVRGPMARIKGLSELIETKKLNADEIEAVAKKIIQCSTEMDFATSALAEFVNEHYDQL